MKVLLAALALMGLTVAAAADPLFSLGVGPLQLQAGVPEPFYCLNGARYVGVYPYGRWVGSYCLPTDLDYGYTGYTTNPGGVVVVPGRPWGGQWHRHEVPVVVVPHAHAHRFAGPHGHH